jgi:hypothetical protein
MMRRILPLIAVTALAGLPVAAAPPEAARGLRPALQAAIPGAQLVWWHAGGTTAAGGHWHASGTGGRYRWGGAYHGGYHPPTYYHGYGGVHYGGFYRPPVAATPWVHPAGTFAAGAVVGAAAGAAAASSATAASSAAHYSQPPTVVNNYYYNTPG